MKIETAPFFNSVDEKASRLLADYGRNFDAFLISGKTQKLG